MIPGVDVSDWQGSIDWGSVAAAGYQFAITKATEGTGFTARRFQRNWNGIKAAGMARGAYHFAQPDLNAPAAEADFFVQQVGELETGDLLTLDLEAGSGFLADWALEWLNRVTERVGFRPLLYSSVGFLDAHGCTGNAQLAEFGLWLASWRSTIPPPPSAWPFIAFWQHTDKSRVPGIEGLCDGDFFNGTRERLGLYGKLARSSRASRSLSAPEPVAPLSYVVRVGETPSSIAAACSASLDELRGANPQIDDLGTIEPGAVLYLPSRARRRSARALGSPPGQTFPVRSATNLADIAATLNVSVLALEYANPHLANPNLIPAGELLTVPPSFAD